MYCFCLTIPRLAIARNIVWRVAATVKRNAVYAKQQNNTNKPLAGPLKSPVVNLMNTLMGIIIIAEASWRSIFVVDVGDLLNVV